MSIPEKINAGLKKLISLVLCMALLLPAFDGLGVSAVSTVAEGTYRIKNAATGYYLNVYNYNYWYYTTYRVYVSPFSSTNTAESIKVTDAGNGCFRLIPGNDSSKYAISCDSGTQAGAKVTKKSTFDSSCLFDITPVGDGYYTIAPSVGDNERAVLAAGTEKNGSDIYVTVADYAKGDRTQLWTFETVSTTSLTLSVKQTTLKLYTTGTFSAAKQPSGEAVSGGEWTSSDESILMVGNDGGYCTLGTGKVTVSVNCDGCTASFGVTVVDKDCFTWYSQNNASGSDWDGTILQNQYWYSNGTYKKYMWDGATSPYWANWMDTGCAICSVAMVLHNMGATMTKGIDLRNGQNGNLAADPYTVSLANTFNTNITSVSNTVYGNPSLVAWQYVADAFELDGQKIAYYKTWNPSRYTINQMLKDHPQGIIAEMSRGSSTHYVVLSQCTNENQVWSTYYNFKIYDPAAYKEVYGRDVDFGSSTSALDMSYSLYNIKAIVIYDTADVMYEKYGVK